MSEKPIRKINDIWELYYDAARNRSDTTIKQRITDGLDLNQETRDNEMADTEKIAHYSQPLTQEEDGRRPIRKGGALGRDTEFTERHLIRFPTTVGDLKVKLGAGLIHAYSAINQLDCQSESLVTGLGAVERAQTAKHPKHKSNRLFIDILAKMNDLQLLYGRNFEVMEHINYYHYISPSVHQNIDNDFYETTEQAIFEANNLKRAGNNFTLAHRQKRQIQKDIEAKKEELTAALKEYEKYSSSEQAIVMDESTQKKQTEERAWIDKAYQVLHGEPKQYSLDLESPDLKLTDIDIELFMKRHSRRSSDSEKTDNSK